MFLDKSAAINGINSSRNKLNVRLPKLERPKFNGDLKLWQTFIDLYKSLVHNQASLDPIEKFNYLLLSLSGDPLTLIKSIPPASDNYIIGYNTLVERYSNKRLLATSHLRVLKSYQTMTKENVRELRRLVDTFNENLSILETLGFNVKSWDFINTDLLLEKLDSSTRKRFELQLKDKDNIPKYDELNELLLKKCLRLETISVTSSTSSTSVTITSSKFNGKFQKP